MILFISLLPDRLQWISKLDHQISLIQETMSELAPIFERYTKEESFVSKTNAISPAPLSQTLLEVHQIDQVQVMILRQLTQ